MCVCGQVCGCFWEGNVCVFWGVWGRVVGQLSLKFASRMALKLRFGFLAGGFTAGFGYPTQKKQANSFAARRSAPGSSFNHGELCSGLWRRIQCTETSGHM